MNRRQFVGTALAMALGPRLARAQNPPDALFKPGPSTKHFDPVRWSIDYALLGA